MEHRKMYPAKYAPFIAMKLDEGDELIGVATLREGDDVLLQVVLVRDGKLAGEAGAQVAR